MKCPKCKTTPLVPSKLEDGLPAMGCNQCNGALLSLLYYRDWLERTPPDEASHQEAGYAEEVNETTTANLCPKCGKLMRKFLVSQHNQNRIDWCHSCDEVWLDGGEWQQLKSIQSLENIANVLTESWQRRVKEAITQQSREKQLRRQLDNAEDTQWAITFKARLSNHPHRADILNFLNKE